MKNFLLIFLLVISTLTFGQKKISGKYSSHFGEKIELRIDSTFIYNWRFDLVSSWSRGNWSIENNTIYLNVIPVMDTLIVGTQSDSLVVSSDQTGNRTTTGAVITNSLSGGGQNRKIPLKKLYFKNGKLYRITDKNKIDDKKHQQLSTGKKFKSFFYRTDKR